MTEKCTWEGKCCDDGERTNTPCYESSACGCKVVRHDAHRFPFKDTGITTTDSYLHEEKE